MQTSMVFSQKTWPGVGDTDDCWVLSSIQMVHAVAPWLYLPGNKDFRAAAGDPDDGVTDGGNVNEIVKGIETYWPVLKGKTIKRAGVSWATLGADLLAGRPVSLSVDSSKLPAALQYGFKGFHQITVVKSGAAFKIANPLEAAYARWDEIPSMDTIKEAILGYGVSRTGTRAAWYVTLPTQKEMLKLHPDFAAAAAGTADAALKAQIGLLEAQLTQAKATIAEKQKLGLEVETLGARIKA